MVSGDTVTVEVSAEGTMTILHNGVGGIIFNDVHGDLYGAVTFGAPDQVVTTLPI